MLHHASSLLCTVANANFVVSSGGFSYRKGFRAPAAFGIKYVTIFFGSHRLNGQAQLNRVLGGVSTHQRERLAFRFKAVFLYSSAEKFCAKMCELIKPVCLKEIVQILSDDQTASPVREPLGN